jgi:hypothetical protein
LRPIPSPEVPAIENLDPLRPRGVREPWEHWKHHRSSSKVPTPATAKGLSWNLHSSRGLGKNFGNRLIGCRMVAIKVYERNQN